jgi:predicted  nucleic acid-binding Zn-ribbon protein
LKSEVERYRNQVIKYELSIRENNPDLRASSRSSRKPADEYKYL